MTARCFIRITTHLILTFGFSLAPHVGCAQTPDKPRGEYQWRFDLPQTMERGMLYRLPVSPDIYHASEQFPSDVRILDEEGNEWPYFLYRPDEDPRRPKIGEVDRDEAKWTIEMAILSVTADPNRPGVQQIVVDALARNLPLHRMHLNGMEEGVIAPVKVYGANQPEGPWRWVAEGGLHAVDGQVRNTLTLPATGYRYFRLDVFHYDGPAVDLTSITAERRPAYFVVEAASSAPAHLYVGSDLYRLPYYDLRSRTDMSEADEAPLIQFGDSRTNPARLKNQLGVYQTTLLALVGLAFGLMFTVLVIRWFRRRLPM